LNLFWKALFGWLQILKLYQWSVEPNYAWVRVALANPWRLYYGGPSFGVALSPYGVYWYAFNSLQILGQYYGVLLLGLDSLFILLLERFRHPVYTLGYSLTSLVFLAWSPFNLIILWLAVLGREKIVMSLTAAIAKLPVGAPPSVWEYIWNVSLHSSGQFYTNLPFYLLTGFWIIHPVFYKLKKC